MNQDLWKQKVDLFRRRFGAREDVFGTRYVRHEPEEGPDGITRMVEVSSFSPQYANKENKTYERLTDEWVWRHISGEKDLLLYLLQKDGIKFGACDFDYGTHFEDAKSVRDYSLKLGLPCYIARSSKKGYHLYWFFKEMVPAHLFTSLITYVQDELGFLARYQANPANPLFEVFPKQTRLEEGRLGNGIKVPMIEPKMREGFNCWVDDEAKPFPFEQQWDRFKSMQEVSLEELTKVLEAKSITVLEQPMGRSQSGVRRALEGKNGEQVKASQQKPVGDFWNIVNSCPAMKELWEKNPDGTFKWDVENGKMYHEARVASMSFALATTNGIDVLKERWPSDKTDYYINHAKGLGFHPYTCRAMQEKKICKKGTHPKKVDHCLSKLPPTEIHNGVRVVNPNGLPEEQWPDPSPFRFATGFMTYDQIMEELDHLFKAKKEGTAPENMDERLYALLRQSKKLSPEEQKNIHQKIIANKHFKAKELKDLDKKITMDIKSEELNEFRKETKSFRFQNNEYFLDPSGKYVMVYVDAKGVPRTKELTNFIVEIKEELIEINNLDTGDKGEQQVEKRYFRGSIVVGGDKRYSFTTDAAEWVRSGESFFSFLVNRAGSDLIYMKSDYDHIRICVNHFSKDAKLIRKKVMDFGHYLLKGEHVYVTPSVIVTRDGIRPNTDYELEFRDDASKPLDFRILDDSQFKEVASHIINDYFGCNSSKATMTAFAHALSASILSHLPLQKSPMLWLNGNFSSGKSFVAEAAQNLFGNFSTLTGMSGTGKSKLQVAHNFRDAMLVIDDFKTALADRSGKEMIQFIHTAYDRSGRTALNRNGTMRENSTRVRGMVSATGEDYPVNEASAISRMLLVNLEGNCKNIVRGEKVKEMKPFYCGFTPHFVHYVYNMSESEIRNTYKEYFNFWVDKMKEGYTGDSGHRIAENLAMNMTAFRLAMEMLVVRGVVPVQRKDELCRQHTVNLDNIRTTICANVSAQKGGTMFLDSLRELIQDPSKHHIINWPGLPVDDYKNSKPIGFYRDKTPDVVYIYPSVARGEVSVMMNKNHAWLQSTHHIARQLYEDNHIPTGMYDSKSTTFTKQVVTPMGTRMHVWVVKLDSLGLMLPDQPGSPGRKYDEESNVVSMSVN